MNQPNPFFQGGTTLIDPVSLSFTIVLGIALIAVPRRWVLLPLCLTLCFVPMQQRIVIAGLDFDMGRIMILFGWARLLARGEFRFASISLDRWFVAWLAAGTLFSIVSVPGTGALVYRSGIMFDALGMFFLCRAIVRTDADVENVIEILCWIALAITPFMLFEAITGFNPFSVLGGVDAHAMVREGRVRAQGSFAHPIMAGTFGATFFPLAIALWRATPQRRRAAAGGIVGALAIALLPASSGPVIALMMGVVGWGLWVLRDSMRLVRWGVVALLLVLHVIREKPVWHLIGRVSDLIGGGGWHRYALIDAFFYNWRDWFLVGIGTRSTRNWGFGLEDVTNQFVAEGVKGGIVTLVVFVALLSASFVAVSRILTRTEATRAISATRRHRDATLSWGLGVCMTAHCASWISVSYFGQMWPFLYLHLALIAALRTDPGLWAPSDEVPSPAHERVRSPDPDPEPEPEPETAPASPSLGGRLFGPGRARFATPSDESRRTRRK